MPVEVSRAKTTPSLMSMFPIPHNILYMGGRSHRHYLVENGPHCVLGPVKASDPTGFKLALKCRTAEGELM